MVRSTDDADLTGQLCMAEVVNGVLLEGAARAFYVYQNLHGAPLL